MKLPLIKHINQFIKENDEDYVNEAIETLEHISQSPILSDDEMNVIGELISNMYGSIEVNKLIQNGEKEKDALNGFMKRVLGSIDK